MSEEDSTQSVGRLQKARGMLRRVGGLYTYSLVGDLSGEVERKRNLWRALHDMATGKRAGRSETFAQAVRRSGADDDALQARIKTLGRMAMLYFIVAGVAFLMLLASPWVAKPLSQFLMSLGVFAMCSARGVAARFRMFQIRNRELVGFREWLERGRQ
ncbi:hypothetical protein [Xanthomonas citri]|uniref:hypothetical protein n=1 Tax=Xanthomonas citri TaxID=346 RepID=UPI0011AF0236|nr:hypothetical protein [Xanthomonas citri]